MLSSVIRSRQAVKEESHSYEHDVLRVHVRPLAQKDCHKALALIHDLQYDGNAKSISLDVMQGKLFLAFVAVVALFIYLLEESNLTMVVANIWFFGSIAFCYWYVRCRICRDFFYHSARDTMSEDEFYQFWTDKDHGHHMWVAENMHGTVIGVAGVVNKSDRVGELTRLAVNPQYHRRSVATQIMLVLLDNCVVRGLEELEACISYKQIPTQKMIKKFGFKTSAKGFFEFGTRPFFRVRAAKYVLSLERND